MVGNFLQTLALQPVVSQTQIGLFVTNGGFFPFIVMDSWPLHTQAKSHDYEIVRAQKKSVQRPSQDTYKIM